ncbi:MAG TPA: hypothetical protein VF085_07125 [Solirubrobacterales bacterium]
MRTVAWAAAMATLSGTLLASAALAMATPPRLADLNVRGGADAWHADNNRFELNWTIPADGGSPGVTTHYRIRNPQGVAVVESVLSRLSDGVGGVTVPKIAGTYGFEIWLEDKNGEQGPAAATTLRFDDARPGAIEPLPVPSWIGRTSFPLRIRLAHPAGPPLLSGIRGYAIAVDARPSGAPCAASDRCSDTETTLRGGVGEDELEIAALPEGTSYLHGVAVSGAGMKSATTGSAVLRVDTADPHTQLAGVPSGWTNRTAQLIARATDAGAGMTSGSDGRTPFTAIEVDGGAPTIAPGATVATSVIDEGVHRVAYYARDAAGNVNDGATSNGIVNLAPGVAWVRIDRTPPTIAFANAQDPRDPDLVRARISDSLSGPDLSRGWIGVRLAGSGDGFEPLPTATPGNGELRSRWDSDTHAEGEYEFKVIGYDAAGNVAAATRRRNGAPMILANPLKTTTKLSYGFQDHGLSRTVPYGRGVMLHGRLIAGRSSPLVGMPVRIVERFSAGADPATHVSTVRTGPEGSFSFHAAPGPSRTIAMAFDGSPTLARSTGSELDLRVRGRVRLRASAGFARIGGKALVFGGRVVTAPGTIPPTGRSVQMQFRLPGLPWAEFRTVQTDRHGRFRYAYRFSDDDSRGARFQFRAYLPAQDDWPYEPAGSRPVIVRGR